MRKSITLILIVVFLFLSTGSIGFAQAGPNGPATEYHDGDPNGSGLESPFGLIDGPGPAPGAGDGDPDGPEW